MIALYARNSPDEILTRVGRKYAKLETACQKARTLAVFECEVRDLSLPRSRSLKTICEVDEQRLQASHGDSIHAKEYRAALALIDAHTELWIQGNVQ